MDTRRPSKRAVPILIGVAVCMLGPESGAAGPGSAALNTVAGIEVQEVTPRTNIVACTPKRSSSSGFAAQRAQAGVQAIPLIGDRLRFVTHRDVSRKQIVEAIEAAKKVASELAAPRASR